MVADVEAASSGQAEAQPAHGEQVPPLHPAGFLHERGALRIRETI
jgi:hypothetical protein